MNPIVRTVIFTVVVPGTVAVVVPRWILQGNAHIHAGASLTLAVPLIAAGVSIYLWCAFWAFALVGQGTPAIFDAPRRLVAHGLYRVVRNPMYWGVSFILLGEAILFHSWALVCYMAVWFAFVFFFVLLFEEPVLRRKFGAEYEEYCRRVPRWLPKLRRDAKSA